MMTGAGYVSLGPGYRLNFNDNKAFFDTSAAVSWHLYKMAQARLQFSQLAGNHLTLGAQAMWQDVTQANYFGIGSNAVGADQSQYRLKTLDVVGYTAVRPVEGLSFDAEVGWLQSPQLLATAGSFNPNYPDARVLYGTDPAMSAASQPDFLHSELSVTATTLDSRSHPTAGGLYRAALTTYRDRAAGTYSFDQYEGEVVQMVPVVDRRVVLGLHGWTVFTDTGAGHQVPFYLMPSIGGNNTLRAYDDFQFHERNTIVVSAELRVALSPHLDLAGFYDAGNVAARYGDLNFDKRSIGSGIRFHLRNTTLGRMDVAHGTEGWRVIFRTTDPFQLSRVTRRTAAVPFTP
jgi:outer membrane protein assembly factor BamA